MAKSKLQEMKDRYLNYEKDFLKKMEEGFIMKKKLSFEEYREEYNKLAAERKQALAEGKKLDKKTPALLIKEKMTSTYSKEHMGDIVDGFRKGFASLSAERQAELLSNYPEIAEVLSGTNNRALIEKLRKEAYDEPGLRKTMFDLNASGILVWTVTSPDESED